MNSGSKPIRCVTRIAKIGPKNIAVKTMATIIPSANVRPVLTLLTPSTLLGWGSEGHEIVASLAQARLNENAKKGIRALIGDASLASVANWADEVRPERDETYNWHFVDIPESASGFSDGWCRRFNSVPGHHHLF